jgi:hypothetical protein
MSLVFSEGLLHARRYGRRVRQPAEKAPIVHLDSYHKGTKDEIIGHDRGILRPGPPRRFVFAWREDGSHWEMNIVEKDGVFSGKLERDWVDDGTIVGSCGLSSDGQWELTVTWTPKGDSCRHYWTIWAPEMSPDDVE